MRSDISISVFNEYFACMKKIHLISLRLSVNSGKRVAFDSVLTTRLWCKGQVAGNFCRSRKWSLI